MMKNVEKKQTMQGKCSALILEMVSSIAEKNAIPRCRGLLYEPEIPKKLRKENQ